MTTSTLVWLPFGGVIEAIRSVEASEEPNDCCPRSAAGGNGWRPQACCGKKRGRVVIVRTKSRPLEGGFLVNRLLAYMSVVVVIASGGISAGASAAESTPVPYRTVGP